MAILVVSAEDFDKKPAEYKSGLQITKVVVVDHDTFTKLSSMKSATEIDFVNAKVTAMLRAEEISLNGPDFSVDDLLLQELRGRAT